MPKRKPASKDSAPKPPQIVSSHDTNDNTTPQTTEQPQQPTQQPPQPTNTDGKDTTTHPTNDTTQPPTTGQTKNPGNLANPVAAGTADSLELAHIARVRDGETKSQCWERLRREGRAAGMTRKGAIAHATGEVERLFPPPEPVESAEPELIAQPISHLDDPEPDEKPAQPEPISEDHGVSGLGELPRHWPELPANAQLQVEIAWVTANRLRVRSGKGVDLARALSPAPSYSALSWLETSILFPSKFADISVKATADQDDEKEFIKREKLAIEEIRSILKEMLAPPAP